MTIDFSCATCGGRDKNLTTNFPEFPVSAYDQEVIAWSQLEGEIPALNKNNHWLLSDSAPDVGEKRVVGTCHPFNENLGTDFWTLFVPSRSVLDGWAESIEDIDRSAFVQCQVLKILEKSEHRAWLQVKVTDRIMLGDTLHQVPAVLELSPLFRRMYKFEHCQLLNSGNLQYYFGSSQGNLGNWMVLEQCGDRVHAIALGEWNFHQHSAFSGNLILTEKTYDDIVNRCAAY